MCALTLFHRSQFCIDTDEIECEITPWVITKSPTCAKIVKSRTNKNGCHHVQIGMWADGIFQTTSSLKQCFRFDAIEQV